MEKYLISLDLDDTILNKKKKIPFFTKLGLKALLQNGHYVILNSGRSIQGMLPYIKQLKLYNYPFISANGGCIYYVNRRLEIVKSYPYYMKTDLINSLFKELEPYLGYVLLQSVNERFYYNEKEVPYFFRINDDLSTIHMIDEFSFKQSFVAGAFGIKKEYQAEATKILSKKKYQEFSLLAWGEYRDYICYDIQGKNINKGTAMLDLAKKLKVKPTNILAFGDSLNDTEMLLSASKGYLMPKSDEMAQKYNIPQIEKDSNHAGVIRYLFKHYRDLF